ncbi:MAG: DEAD/DEAH box helicase [Ferrimicrobium sp.]
MLSDQVAAILQARDNLNPQEIAQELIEVDHDDPALIQAVEGVLFAGHRRYQRSRSDPQRWSLANHDDQRDPAQHSTSCVHAPSVKGMQSAFAHARHSLPSPYSWQLEALTAWRQSNRRGIVEAVTGSGKTMVGILALLDALEAGAKVHIVVPTIELQRQWLARIREILPSQTTIGRCGGGHHASLASVDILISVVNSARSSHGDYISCDGDLIIADECHRMASKLNSGALAPEFTHRLGLSATYRRDDNGHDKFLLPYFERICYALNYDRARLDAVIADFGVVFVGVNLSDDESENYEYLSKEITALFTIFYRRFKRELSNYLDPIGTLRDAAAGRYSYIDERLEDIAKSLLAAMRRRRRLLESASAKLDALVALGPEIRASKGTIVFTQSIEVAKNAASALNNANISSRAIHSKTDKEVRAFHIRRFATGELQAIVAPRILDEGIDFPDADFAVVLAAANSRRQMIQRMGRVLRPKKGGLLARFAVVFAQDTIEDPRLGAHEIFRRDVADSANILGIVPTGHSKEALRLLESLRSR